MTEKQEEEILLLCKKPHTKDRGFTLLMDAYKERTYWHIRRLVVSHEDAEDILQETFINVYNHIGKFSLQSRIYTWIYRIAINECFKLFRKKKLRTGFLVPLGEILIKELPKEIQENTDELLIRLQKAILRLPEKQQIVFTLRYYDDMSYEEIAEIVNTSVGTLKTNYHYAKEKIKTELTN